MAGKSRKKAVAPGPAIAPRLIDYAAPSSRDELLGSSQHAKRKRLADEGFPDDEDDTGPNSPSRANFAVSV